MNWPSYCNNKEVCKFFPYLRDNLRKDYSYGNALVTRPYVDQKDKGVAIEVFHGFKKIFSDRDLIIVEGEKTRFGVGNDLLSGAKSVRRIIAPAKNAFDKYKEIFIFPPISHLYNFIFIFNYPFHSKLSTIFLATPSTSSEGKS